MLVAAVAGTGVCAHRRDEYLQAARLAVEPDRVRLELDLTPGIALADATIADLDVDRNGALSDQEKHAYAARVFDALVLELDGRALRLDPIGATFPDVHDVRRGEGTMQLRAIAALPRPIDGDHQLSFENRHHRDGSVYLANALVPASDRVTIVAQRRDPDQRELTIDYVLRRTPSAAVPAWMLGSLAAVMALVAAARRAKRRDPDVHTMAR